jgi:rhamnose transport system permease protein
LGVFIAVFVLGFPTFGLGLLNVPGTVMTVLIGFLLILAIATPILIRRLTLLRRRGSAQDGADRLHHAAQARPGGRVRAPPRRDLAGARGPFWARRPARCSPCCAARAIIGWTSCPRGR